MKPKVAERDVQKAIIAYLKDQRILVYRSGEQGQLRMTGPGTGMLTPSQSRGCPDLTGVLPGGTALYIEVKHSHWKPPSEEAMDRAHARWCREGKKDPYDTWRYQRAFLTKVAKAGALTIIARSIEEVAGPIDAFLLQADKEVPSRMGNYGQVLGPFDLQA